VVINVLDKRGKVIDDMDSEVKTIEPNSNYTFNLQITDEKAAGWELADIKNEKEE
jgi:glycine cleavage system regulatory protein